MKHTEHYQLSQFESDDRIMKEDFNADNAKIDAALAGMGNCRIATGSYTGDGQCGTDKPVTLTFPFSPQMVVIMTNGANFIFREDIAHWAILVRGVTSFRARYSTSNINGTSYAVEWGENTVSWHAAGNSSCAEGQLNISGRVYYYVAIG